jgi:hypothetical protein
MIFCTYYNLFCHLGLGCKRSRATVISVDPDLKLIRVRLLNPNPKTSIYFTISNFLGLAETKSHLVAENPRFRVR